MRVRRLRKYPAHLEITAFINLIVVLVPFLLSTAVFSRLAVLDLTLPAKSAEVEQLKVDTLQLEVVIRADVIEVGDRIGGLIQRIGKTGAAYDVRALSTLIRQIKERFPDTVEASVLSEQQIAYESLVLVMDALREAHVLSGTKVVRHELFPQISIGDAPVVRP